MSVQENTRLVQQAYESFQAGNIEALLSLLSDDVQWQLPEIENVPIAGRRQGPEQVAEFFATLANTQEVQAFEPQQFVAEGDQVVALGHYAWRIKSTGRMFESDWAHVFTVREGKIARFQEYTDTAAEASAYKNDVSA